MTLSSRQHTQSLLRDALSRAVTAGDLPATVAGELPEVERPRRPELGDFASNIAMVLARQVGKPPREVAETLRRHLAAGAVGSDLVSADVAGPGFLNLRLSSEYWQGLLGRILQAGADWGRGEPRPSPRILVEYLSANPTGPLHFAHGRHAVVGDSLVRLLRFAGYPVTAEFYINDAGNQVTMLGRSIWARYMEAARAAGRDVPEVAFPDNGYKGQYVRELGARLWREAGDRYLAAQEPEVGSAAFAAIRGFGIAACLDMIRTTLHRFEVTFDVWQSERALHEAGEVTETLAALEAGGYVERKDDAVWLRTTALWNDDKDRVVVKSDGQPTYLLADIAYHRKKIARGFDELCNILGSDHHGHIPRMKAALKAFGHDPERLGVILIQMVSLVRDGKPVAMGKREGEFITLDDVIDEVGRDATRFFYLMRRHDTPLEFDLELAKRRSMDNPVYYAQYAHARCVSILRKAAALDAPRPPLTPALAARLALPEEIAILRTLGDFPDFVADAGAAREPHRLTAYLHDLASAFQSYYTQLAKVHGDSILPPARLRESDPDWRARWDWERTAARLCWVEAVRIGLANAMALLGVAAPESMERDTEDGRAEE